MNGDAAGAFRDWECDARARERLARFTTLLLARNASVNLSAARDLDAVAVHIRDSLTVTPFARSPLVDVGSGGGFPAIPLAIVTGVEATLIEAVGKKAAFLREVVADLALPIRVVQARAEDAGRWPELRESFESATARAVGGVPTVLELTVPLLRVGGVAVLQRGRLDERERAAASDAALVLQTEFVEETVVDRASGRCILTFRKMAPTGPRFPRRTGVPAKRPLCDDTP